MSCHYHAVLWIDHHEARIIRFNAADATTQRIRPRDPPKHLHAKAGSASGTHMTDDPQFYNDIIPALAQIPEIFVTGPSTAKIELIKHLNKNAPQLAKRIAGVAVMGEVTDDQLVAEARRYFASADRMRPQLG